MLDTTAHTKFFDRPATNERTQLTAISRAYEAYGLTAPTRALDIKKTVDAGGSNVHAVSDALARDAFLSDQDPDEWYADALEQIREAVAREALAKAFGANYEQNLRPALPKLLAEAAGDLEKHVAKTVKSFVTAAKHLPDGPAALDPEANLASNTGDRLYTARGDLARLGTVAGIYPTIINDPTITSTGIKAILPIVEFPPATVEQVQPSHAAEPTTLNGHELAGTRTIRKIADDLHKQGIDLVLVSIAQGAYEGASIKFGNIDTCRARRTNLTRAFSRTRV